MRQKYLEVFRIVKWVGMMDRDRKIIPSGPNLKVIERGDDRLSGDQRSMGSKKVIFLVLSVCASCAIAPIEDDSRFRSTTLEDSPPLEVEVLPSLIKVKNAPPDSRRGETSDFGQVDDLSGTVDSSLKKVDRKYRNAGMDLPQISKELVTASARNGTVGSIAVQTPSDPIVLYTVKPGDTLMKISFSITGNVYRWKEIFELNKELLKGRSALVKGMVIKVSSNGAVMVKQEGAPYLIRRKDTLWRISGTVYGQPSFWNQIWDNNRELIRDPNRIYTGFTLYYRPLAGNKVALRSSEPGPSVVLESRSVATPPVLKPDITDKGSSRAERNAPEAVVSVINP